MMVQLEVLEVEALENVTELDVGLGIDDIAVRDISESISWNATEFIPDDFEIVGLVDSIGDLTT